MNLAELVLSEPTLSENNSRLVYEALLTERATWRCYSPLRSSGGRAEVDKLCERFLRSHATVPSVFSEQVLASTPMEVFACTWGLFTLQGGLYMNGAVVHVKHPTLFDGEPYHLLFIDPIVAVRWGYPDDYNTLATAP